MKDSLMRHKCRYSESDMEFHSEQIEVVRGGKSKEPTSFIWKRKDYKIKEMLESWADWGFPPGSPKKKSWRLREPLPISTRISVRAAGAASMSAPIQRSRMSMRMRSARLTRSCAKDAEVVRLPVLREALL